MGVCASKTDGGKAAAQGKTIQKTSPSEEKLPKLLLIGAGGSGKSTILKQLRLIFGKGFDENDRQEIVPIVHHNLISSMQSLCSQSEMMKLEVSCPDARNYMLNMLSSGDYQEAMNPTSLRHLQSLWRDEGIQRTYEQRHTFSPPLMEHAEYFLNKAEVTARDTYLPTDLDLLRCCARTTGIVETSVSFGDQKFVVYDVGGQRAERRKWVHCFKEASCLIYVAGVSGFDEKLIEDPDDNRLSEEFKLFEGVCDMFPTKQIFLILNKIDVLREKVQRGGQRGNFSSYFPECRDDSSVESVLAWIKHHFLARNKFPDRYITVYNMVAVNPEQVRTTFTQIKDVVPKILPAPAAKS